MKSRKIISNMLIIILMITYVFGFNINKGLAINEKTEKIICLEPEETIQDNLETTSVKLNNVNIVNINEKIFIPINNKFKQQDVDYIGLVKDNEYFSINASFDKNNIIISPEEKLNLGTYTISIILKSGKIFDYAIKVSNMEVWDHSFSNYSTEYDVIKIYPLENEKGFRYPYILAIPKYLTDIKIKNSKEITVIVETQNNGTCGDLDEQEWASKGRFISTLGFLVAKDLKTAFVMPMFPRGVDENGDYKGEYYQHALDRDTLENRMKEPVPIDQQVLAIIKDSQKVLRSKGINVEDKVAMIGFSASGDFVNRFSILHPEIIKAMAFQNTKPILPLKEYKGEKLIYPVGIGDIEEITGKPVNIEEYKKINQYIFTGELDNNDGVYFYDGYEDSEREQIFRLLGKQMMPDRWNNVQKIYNELKYPIQFVTYKNHEHDYNGYILGDVETFIKNNLGTSFKPIIPIEPVVRFSKTGIETARISGNDRYETSVNISKEGWTQSNCVIVSNGEDFPDALLASSLAGKYDAPIILTQPHVIKDTTIKEVERLQPKTIYIVGNTKNVGEEVESKLQTIAQTVIRVSGSNRYDESMQVAKIVGLQNGVIVTCGTNFPDVLSIAPLAGSKQIPIIFGDKAGLNSELSNFVSSNEIPKSYIIGGTGVLSSSLDKKLPNAKRLCGLDRYSTNIAVVSDFEGDLNFNTVYLATGKNYPDALSGAALAAKNNAPIFLTDKENISPDLMDYFKKKNVGKVIILGGTGVISEQVVNIITGM